MYTRNYRIQHGDKRPEAPQNDDLHPTEPDDVSAVEVGETLEESEMIEEVTAERKAEASKVVLEEDVSALSVEEREESSSVPRAKLRAVKSFRVRTHPVAETCAEPSSDDAEPEEVRPLAEEVSESPSCSREKEYFEPCPDRRFNGRAEKHTDKKPFGAFSAPFGLKNFSAEDIFLCAILLLLLNEGCEDIMTLILGFLLIS